MKEDIVNLQTELLKDSLRELEQLRERSIYQGARLQMFDDMMLLLRAHIPDRGAMNGGEDVVWRIKSFIRNMEAGATSDKQ